MTVEIINWKTPTFFLLSSYSASGASVWIVKYLLSVAGTACLGLRRGDEGWNQIITIEIMPGPLSIYFFCKNIQSVGQATPGGLSSLALKHTIIWKLCKISFCCCTSRILHSFLSFRAFLTLKRRTRRIRENYEILIWRTENIEDSLWVKGMKANRKKEDCKMKRIGHRIEHLLDKLFLDLKSSCHRKMYNF